MNMKLALALVMISVVLASISLAENVTTSANGDVTTDTTVSTTTTQQDADTDGVIDMYDACPDTPRGAIIIKKVTEPINYLGELINRNGCTCDQLRERYDFATNPCAYFQCYQDSIFELKSTQYLGDEVTCPLDTCDETTYTYYDYPESGFPRCDQFRLLAPECTPLILKNATQCGYVTPAINTETGNDTLPSADDATTLPVDNTTPSSGDASLPDASTDETPSTTGTTTLLTNQENVFMIPELTGTFQKNVTLDQAEIRFAYPRISREGQEIHFAFLLIQATNNRQRIQPIVFVDGTEVRDTVADESYNNDDGTTEFILYTLRLPQVIGEHQLVLDIQKNNNVIYNFEGTYDVRVSQINLPVIPETKVVQTRANGELDAEDYAFTKAIYDELTLQYATDKTLAEFDRAIATASKQLRVSKEQEYSAEANTTTYTVHIEPKKNKALYNVTIIEYIPKEIAQSAQDITFTILPTTVLADDPLIMWHFAAVDERIDLEYKVSGDVQATGNTIATVETGPETTTPWHIILPVIIIPLLILLLVIFPHMHRHEK